MMWNVRMMWMGFMACGAPQVEPVTSVTPDADAPPVTAAPGSALHYAQTCAQYLGPIPAMSCADALEIPTHINGERVDGFVGEGCDNPSALTGDCQTGYTGKYIGSHHNGDPRPEVVFMNFCRDGGFGVIGHNATTGATCFFHHEPNRPNTDWHPGSNEPEFYDSYWQTPDIVAADNCQRCHQADPWLHSPWIDQLKDPDQPDQPLVPLTAGPQSPYVIIGEAFSQPVHTGAPENSCTSCHRAQCDTEFSVPLGELQMPAPFHSMATPSSSETRADLDALREWCHTL